MSLPPNSPLDSLPQPDAAPALPATIAPAPGENPAWGLLDVLLIAVFGVIAMFFLTAIGFVVMHFIPGLRHMDVAQLSQEPLVVLPPQTLAYVATLFFMMLVVRRESFEPFWDAVNWRWPANVLPFILGGLVLSLSIQLGSAYLPIPKSLPIDQFFKTTRAAWLLAVFGIFIAPFFEELFFRGFFYPALYRRMGLFAAVVVNSLVFALFHEGQLAHAWAPLLVLFIVGCVLTLVRAKSGSVACSFVVHAAYNAFLFGSIFVVTGGFRHMEKLTA